MIQKTVSIFAFFLIALAIMIMATRGTLVAGGIFGKFIQIASFCCMIWARVAFGSRSFHFSANPTTGGLVTSGPYKFVRHPIYAAVLFFIWPGALTHLSVMDIVLAAIITLGTAIRIVTEERLVAAMYPEYKEYASRTKRIVPFIF